MRHISASLTITLTLALSALGNIYANSPLASTVWTAGQSEKIAWMDDKSSPKLSKLGPVDIQLYAGDGNLVATLASGIDATGKTATAWISPSWGHDGSDYYIAFRSKEPRVTRYTASFTIVGMAYMSSSSDNPNPNPAAPANSTSTGLHSSQPLQSSFSSSSTSSARPSSTLPPITAEDEEDYLRSHRGTGPTSTASAAMSTSFGGVDWERIKFRIVFVVWPAVIGLTMAL